MIAFPNLGLEFSNISRTAFRIFGLDIYWYGVIAAVAVIILGFSYALKRSKEFGMITDKVFDCAVVGFLGGGLGARLYYVIFYNLNPANETKYTFVTFFTGFREGGLALYGGIIGAILFGFIAMRLKKMRVLPVLDLAGMSFLLGIGVGRWANFFNQEAYGSVTSPDFLFGMTGDRIGEIPVHPCFLYESVWCLLGFALLHFYSKKLRTFNGEIFLLFAAWYGFGRVFIEQLRSDSLMFGEFKISQLLAAASFGAAIGAFIYFKQKTRKAPNLYSDSEESISSIAAYELKLKLDKEKIAAKKALKNAEQTAPSILSGNVGRDALGTPQEPGVPQNETEENENGTNS
ncbi:MAG: prolipoprotein diacylglyceryl transferase [Oscillospiraceae bacterium]|nr:prolipoprotein diacylglyceryl transferase [Oscillospiraceae bacterium]